MQNPKMTNDILTYNLKYLNNAEFQITYILQKLINSTSLKENKIILNLLAEEIKKQITGLKSSFVSHHLFPPASS